jgi:hypothetical protein
MSAKADPQPVAKIEKQEILKDSKATFDTLLEFGVT